VIHMTPSKSKYKPDFDQRRKYDLDKYRSWLRLYPDELKAVAETFAAKLNLAKGPVKMIIPLKGWSGVDRPGQPTYDPAEDRVFIDTLKARLNPQIEILEVDANMEEPQFAQAVINLALKIL
ncbi:MAG: Tm-1-like ATP-binding domain-containing protein, partial [Desulfobacterales bacterium]|nr:Tm-1-like ATP-binding domain-containing protein [Desulfobacterales bacterium]